MIDKIAKDFVTFCQLSSQLFTSFLFYLQHRLPLCFKIPTYDKTGTLWLLRDGLSHWVISENDRKTAGRKLMSESTRGELLWWIMNLNQESLSYSVCSSSFPFLPPNKTTEGCPFHLSKPYTFIKILVKEVEWWTRHIIFNYGMGVFFFVENCFISFILLS